MTIPPLATITGPLTYPGNMTAVASRRITATCVGPEGAVLRDSGGGMVGETTVFTDAGGDFSIDLTLNSDIDEASGVGPPGTYWRLTVGVRPAVSWLVRLETADAGTSIVIGDAARTVVDPTPRGWVPLAGPEGQTGPTSTVPGPAGSPGGGAQVGLVRLAANFEQAPSAAAADVPGMTLTYTAPATPKPIEFELSGSVKHTGGASSATRSCAMQLYEGATLIGPIGFVQQGGFVATGGTVPFRARIRLTPTTGAHTYKLRTYANASSDGTITWLTGIPAFNVPDLLFTIDEH